MNTPRLLSAVSCLTLIAFAGSTPASLTLLTGPSAATHVGNLVTNGSFEVGAPTPGNLNYWATGTTSTPFLAIPSWTASGPPENYALWGDANSPNPPQIAGSDVFPDGFNGVYFGNGLGAMATLPPTFQTDGQVTFPGAVTMIPKYSGPVILGQTVPTNATPAASYLLSFWASGEFAGSVPGPVADGIFGLQVTNVLPGDPTQFFTVPGGGAFGASHRYDFQFVPLNPLLPVTVDFINYGHFDLSAFGGPSFTTELVLDDVIVNAVVPEPVTLSACAFSLPLLLRRRVSR